MLLQPRSSVDAREEREDPLLGGCAALGQRPSTARAGKVVSWRNHLAPAVPVCLSSELTGTMGQCCSAMHVRPVNKPVPAVGLVSRGTLASPSSALPPQTDTLETCCWQEESEGSSARPLPLACPLLQPNTRGVSEHRLPGDGCRKRS